MNLIWFLTIGALTSVILGEFGKISFGLNNLSVSITDVFSLLILFFLLIWRVGILKNIKDVPKEFIILSAFWLVGFLSILFSGNFEGIFYLIRFILYSAYFLVGFYLVKEKNLNIDSLLNLVVLVGVALSVLGFIQFIVFPDFQLLTELGYDPHQYRLASTFLDPNLIGGFLNISLVFALYLFLKNKKVIYIIFLFILLLSLFLTFSRSAYLMFFVSFLILSLAKFKKALILIGILLITLYFIVPVFSQRLNGIVSPDKSASERFESWNIGWRIFAENKIFGVGFGNLRPYKIENNLTKVFSPDGGHSGAGLDSSLLVVLASTGIVGFGVFLSFWFVLIYKILKSEISLELKLLVAALVTGLLVESQFVNSLFFVPVMVVLFLFFGMVKGISKS